MVDITMSEHGLNQINSNGSISELEKDVSSVGMDEQSQFQYPVLFCGKTLLELCNSSWSRAPKAENDVQPYLRGCKWSPDGTCCLTVVNNDGVHVSELPRELYDGDVTANRNIDILSSVIHVKESGLIYDFCWYPLMNSNCPETCFWITSRQNAPIQMWDAFDGSLKGTYRGYNDVDEMEPAVSCTFSSESTRIIAGYKKCLRTFDINRPGREFAEHKISSSASCLATHSNLLAVGSWTTTITLFNVKDQGTYKSIGKMHGHGGGVTHVKFAPNGLHLVSGARKDHRLLVWDIRHYRRPLNVLSRVVDTNQRIYFDISPCGKYLASGGTDGILRVWNMDKVNWKSQIDVGNDNFDSSILKFPLHNDCCNSVSIHPYRPILATGSGQYHMNDPVTSLCKEINAEDSQTLEKTSGTNNRNGTIEKDNQMEISVIDNTSDNSIGDTDLKYSGQSENCLVFWWTGDVKELIENPQANSVIIEP